MAYERSNLTLNVGGRDEATLAEDTCNPGGSWICWSPTKGCGTDPPMTCFGTSTSPKAMMMQVDIPQGEMESLQTELAKVLAKYTSGSK